MVVKFHLKLLLGCYVCPHVTFLHGAWVCRKVLERLICLSGISPAASKASCKASGMMEETGTGWMNGLEIHDDQKLGSEK